MLMRWAVNQDGEHARPKVTSDLEYTDLIELQEHAAKIKVADDFIDQFSEVLDMLESRGIHISDRRRVQILKFMRGWAVVQGEDQVHASMLHQTLRHILYTSPDQIEDINEVVKHVVPTAEEFITSVKRANQNLMRKFENIRAQNTGTATVSDLNEMLNEMNNLLKELKVLSAKAEEALDDGTLKFTAAARLKAVKLVRDLDTNVNTVTTAISRIKP